MTALPAKPKPESAAGIVRPKRRWRRRLLFPFLLLVIAVPAYGIYLEIKSRIPGVTMDNLRRLKVGMTEKEIEAFLGPKSFEVKNEGWEGEPFNPRTVAWRGKELGINVSFDWHGRAAEIVPHWEWPGPPEETLIDKLRQWITGK